MGLIVSVYRDSSRNSDCSNNGISNKHNELTVVNVPGPFEPKEDRPAVLLTKGPLNSVNIKPAKLVDDKWVVEDGLFMYGGNAASTSDSRFGQAVEQLCGYNHSFVKIHDRLEG